MRRPALLAALLALHLHAAAGLLEELDILPALKGLSQNIFRDHIRP